MSFCVSPKPASLRTCSGSMFFLKGTRARDGGGRQNRGKTGLTTQENECEKGKLRLRENRRTSLKRKRRAFNNTYHSMTFACASGL